MRKTPLAAASSNNPVPSLPQPQHAGHTKWMEGSNQEWHHGDLSTPCYGTLVLCWSWQQTMGGNKTVGRGQGQMEGHTDGQTSEVYSYFCSASALAPWEGTES